MITVFRPHQMHEMQAFVTDDRGVCQSVCLSVTRGSTREAARAVCAGSFAAAFDKLF